MRQNFEFTGINATLAIIFFSLTLLLPSCRPDTTLEVHQYEWNEADGYRWAELPTFSRGSDGFNQLSHQRTGVDFFNRLTDDQIAYNRNLLNGSGVAVGDVTGNGFPDIYFTALDGPNILYENLGGFQFRDITEKAGLALDGQFSTGALLADLNGNGTLDLVVTSIDGPNRLFFNNGEGVFEEQADALKTEKNYGSTSIAAGDLTGNGALDLYIVNYKERSVRDIYPDEQEFSHIVQEVDGVFQLRPKFEEHYLLDQRNQFLLWFETGEPDLIFFNDGNGRFEKADLTSGIFLDEDGDPITEVLPDWGLHAKIDDINQNGLPDIYVANDFESDDRIWLNQGNGTFRALTALAMRKSSLSSMAVDFSDINRNGYRDFFVIEMLSPSHTLRHRQMSTMAPSPQPIGVIDNRPQYLGNTLFLNHGDGTYAEISEYAGVRRSDWSWSALFLDITLNGYEDILITNGHYLDVQDSDANHFIRSRINAGQMDMERQMLYYTRLLNQNTAFKNNGDLTFSNVSTEWGFEDLDISHGFAVADLNNNGYPDLVINRLGAEAAIFMNRSNKPRIAIRLTGDVPNTGGIGSKITLEGGPVTQDKWVTGGDGYLSTNQKTFFFAATSGNEHTIRIRWPDGRESIINGVISDRIYEIHQSGAEFRDTEEESEQPIAKHFRDASHLLGHTHSQNDFDDMDRQPLLSKKLSRSGPGISFLDITQNGRDELIITNSGGENLSVFSSQDGDRWNELIIDGLPEDGLEQASTAGWTDLDGRTHLIIGFSNYQSGSRQMHSAKYFIIEQNRASLVQTFEGMRSTAGTFSLADFNGNGYPDLFMAGTVNPGRYPEPASSRLYINRGEHFELFDIENSPFENVGLISGSVFSDITGNGRPELLLSEFWGTIRVFEWQDKTAREITSDFGFDAYRGWWNSVATGDFTGNGRLDIVALNWGKNHEFIFTDDGSNHIFYRDMNLDGYIDLIEAYYSEDVGDIVPRRGLQFLAQYPPFVGSRVRSFQHYATSSLEEILGHSLDRYDQATADTYSHMLFLQNDDGSFTPTLLPEKAQFAPAFQPLIGDFTGDGNQDLFITQNYFAYREDIPRNDAGRGLLLTGDGTGNLAAMTGQESGIKIYGEQRGAAMADINQNGKLDIVAGQNAYQTKLLLNEKAKPGIRVLLTGSRENPSAIGAHINLKYSDGTRGPVTEIQAGAGYRSQNSFVKVLGKAKTPEFIEIRWPDGSASEIPVDDETTEIRADFYEFR